MHVDAVIGFLTEQGFTEIEALEAYTLTSRCVIGATMHTVREQETGNELIAEYHRALAGTRRAVSCPTCGAWSPRWARAPTSRSRTRSRRH